MGQLNCCHRSRLHPGSEQQCDPVPALPEPLLRQRVRVTQGHVAKKRDLLLFSDSLVIAKPKRGSTLHPKLCLALGQLQVLSSGTGAAGDAAEEEEGKATSSLVLIWPCGFCVVTFRSRVKKEPWLSALLGPPEGVEGAQVTQLPSLKPLLKQLSGRNAAMTLRASSLERLVKGQAKAGAEQQLPPVPSGREGGGGHAAGGGSHSRKRRGLPWPFGRRGTSATAEAPGPSGSVSGGALFGQPLAALCRQDGSLPQPIQDLLALLSEHGPSTEGIFRLAASERVSRQLREALDSGAEVDLESQPALLLAVTLKDFLRKIPSKLLDVHLYEEWMSALQKTSRQEKLDGLKEVVSKLPEANLLLLRSLLALLEKISKNVATSKMTIHSLAICVGPNLLSPAEEQTLPLDVLLQETGKVTRLLEFLIEHHGELFEQVVAGTLAEKESPAPGADTAEEPPVAPQSTRLKSTSGERRLPGIPQQKEKEPIRKRKQLWIECDGQPGKKRQKVEVEILGMGQSEKTQAV